MTDYNEKMLAVLALLLVGAVGTLAFMMVYHVMYMAF